MKKSIFVSLLIIAQALTAISEAQIGIGISPANINPSAQLDVNSTSKGLLPPRMTSTQRDAINSPASGLVIFNTTTNSLEYKSSTGWVAITVPTTPVVPDILPTTPIGTQKWMRQNLDVAYYRNGDPIPYVSDPTAWAALTTGAWCYYNNDPANGAIYGKLYNWYAVNDSRGLAPTGWHIPTDAEWTTLTTTLGGETVAGGKMKSVGITRWNTPNTGADNSTGFSALPGGIRAFNGQFGNIGTVGIFWSSSSANSSDAWYRGVVYNVTDFVTYLDWKTTAFSVRCVRD